MGRFVDAVRLARPQFLLGPPFLLLAGAAIAVDSPNGAGLVASLRHLVASLGASYAFAQVFVTLTQLMVHFGNDHWDLAADRANVRPALLSGGSRVLVEGGLPPRFARTASRVCGLLAILVGVAWLAQAGTPVLALALAATWTLSWAYSAPPLRLCGRGLGPAATALIVGLLVPALGFAAQASGRMPSGNGWLALLPLTLGITVLVLVLDRADLASDQAAGKRTAAVRLGHEGTTTCARGLAGAAALLAYAAGPGFLALLASLALAFGLPQRHGAAQVAALANVAAQGAALLAWAVAR